MCLRVGVVSADADALAELPVDVQHKVIIAQDQVARAKRPRDARELDAQLDADHLEAAAVFLLQDGQMHQRRLDHLIEVRLRQLAIVEADAEPPAGFLERVEGDAERRRRAADGHEPRHDVMHGRAFVGIL